MSMIHVVSGLWMNADRFLMGLRKPDKKRPSLWETPGGKVEPGESMTIALEREWREELDHQIFVHKHIATASFDWNGLVVVDLFVVTPRFDNREPKTLDHAELRWVTLEEALDNMPCSPAFYTHYPWIKRWQESR